MLTIFLRSVILYAASLLAMRAMGKRQVGQLQPFELVVVIMIAELAATPMGGVGIPILYGLLPMAALVVCHGLLTALCMKSERVRVWLCGQPTVLVRNGVICEKQLRACAVDLNDLMEAMRAGGILPAESRLHADRKKEQRRFRSRRIRISQRGSLTHAKKIESEKDQTITSSALSKQKTA